jgi:hypothetical protein
LLSWLVFYLLFPNHCLIHTGAKIVFFGQMNNFELCKGICELDQSIIGAGIIVKAKLVAMHNKPRTPIPSEEQFGTLFLQTVVIASITRSNAAYFGQPKYFTLSFEKSDMYFFVLSRYGHEGVLAIQLIPPYNHEHIIGSVDGLLGRTLNL